uniref:T9SS type A sorting domain-containing protein n=1 Tax=Gelidibacter sp. TaxID=2018083 RepID=UPI00404B9C16
MKKITFAFLSLLFTSFTFAQTYSTGAMELINDGEVVYTAKVDVTSSLVTLTLIGPDSRYLGFGFGVQSMTNGGDVVVFYDDPQTPEVDFKISDRTFIAIGVAPSLDANQDWTLISNTLDAGQRTVVGTRVLDTGTDGDYVFSTTDTSLEYVFAVGPSYSFTGIGDAYHLDKKGFSMQSFTLSNSEIALNDFKISPNPAKSKVTISLPNQATNVKLEVFDVLGKKIMTKSLSSMNSTFDVSKWNSGIYLMRLTSDNGTQTKRFVKQ